MYTYSTDTFAHITFDQGQMRLISAKLTETMQGKGAILSFKRTGLNFFYRLLIGNTVVNKVSNRAHFDPMLLCKYLKIITACHRTISVDDFYNHRCGLKAC